jgi:hypothetical protein
MHVAATADAVRLMGVWVSRADAGLARRGAVNAARGLAEERARRRRWQRDEDDALRAAESSGSRPRTRTA